MLLLTLDRNAGTPVYRQIVDQVRFQVASGVLAVGAELPSTRALAAEHGVNPMTVSKAYAELERQEVLERRPGLPHVVAARPEDEQRRERTDALAALLEPAAHAAHALGLDAAEAQAVFARLLAAARGAEEEQPNDGDARVPRGEPR